MFFKFAGKVWALFMPIVLLFNSLSINIAPFADSVEITYAFANETTYSAMLVDDVMEIDCSFCVPRSFAET